MPKTPLTIKLEPQTRQILDQVAEIQGLTRSEIVEGLVREYVRDAVNAKDVRDVIRKMNRKKQK